MAVVAEVCQLLMSSVSCCSSIHICTQAKGFEQGFHWAERCVGSACTHSRRCTVCRSSMVEHVGCCDHCLVLNKLDMQPPACATINPLTRCIAGVCVGLVLLGQETASHTHPSCLWAILTVSRLVLNKSKQCWHPWHQEPPWD